MQMNIEKVRNELSEMKEKATILEAELKEEKAELEKQKKQFTNLKVLHAGKKKTPGSLQTNERSLWEAEKNHELTQGAVTLVNEKISHLQHTLDLCTLYEQEATALAASIAVCEGSIKYLKEGSIEEQILSFVRSLRTLMTNTEGCATHFARVFYGLDKNFSLRSFLDGKFEEVEDDTKERQKLTHEISAKMKEFTNLSNLVSNETIDTLKQTLEQITEWKRMIGSIPADQEIALSRHSLIPTPRIEMKIEKDPRAAKFYPKEERKFVPQKTIFKQAAVGNEFTGF